MPEESEPREDARRREDEPAPNALQRALKVLVALGEGSEGMTVQQVADRSGVQRSTAHRILKTLQEAEFVASTGRGGLRLGPEFVRLATVSRSRLVPIVRPYIEQIAREQKVSVSLGVLEGANVRYLDQAVAGRGVRAISLVGSTLPAHSTAIGKALLAAVPNRAIESLLPRRLEQLTPNTIVDRSDLIADLERARQTGSAYDHDENDEGISGVASSFRDPLGNVAAISLAMPTDQFAGREAFFADEAKTTAAQIEAVLAPPANRS